MAFLRRSSLSQWQKQIDSCQACGQCLAICPLSIASNSEAFAPRAKIALLKAFIARKISKEDTEKLFSICLHCGKCEKGCPAGLPLQAIFSAASSLFPKKSFSLRLLNILQRFPKLTVSLQPLLYLVLRLDKKNNLSSLIRNNNLRAFPFLKRKPKKAQGAPILLYSGCLARNIDLDIAAASHRLAENAGFSVLMPVLPCCGRQNRLNGRHAEYTELVRKNLKILGKLNFEYILSPCPACFREIGEYWPNLPGLNAEEAEFTALLKEKLLDPTDFAYKFNKEKELPAVGALNDCLFHFSCQSQDNNHKLLKELFPTGKFLEKDSKNCCGASLLYSLQPTPQQRALASKLASNMREQILSSRAHRLITNCPACKLQLKKALAQSEGTCEVRHIAELYAELYPPS